MYCKSFNHNTEKLSFLSSYNLITLYVYMVFNFDIFEAEF